MNYPKVLIGHPAWKPTFTRSFYEGMINTFFSYPGELSIKLSEGLSAHWARNYLMNEFKEDKNADYLLFIDTDIGLPYGGLQQLILDKKDIISGLYFGRYNPHDPIMKRGNPQDGYQPVLEYQEGVIPVDIVGGGCLLLSRRVVEDVAEPFFFAPRVDFTEDAYFCEKAKKAGIEIFIDTRVKCKHDSDITIDETMSKLNRGVK